MEQEEEYKLLIECLGEVEKYNLNDPVPADYLEKMRDRAIQDVEAEFKKCATALLASRDVVLNDLNQGYQQEDKNREEREVIIKAYKESLEAGSLAYQIDKSAGSQMWQIAAELRPKSYNNISVSFAGSLAEAASAHGSVTLISGHVPFTRAENVVTLAGSTSGNVDGNGANAKFDGPQCVCFNPVDNCLYVTDSGNNSIRKVTTEGEVITFSAKQSAVQLDRPFGIAPYYKENSFYICSREEHTIKKVSATGVISTVAGSRSAGFSDGVGDAARFNNPHGIAVDQNSGDVFVADTRNHLIRKISPQGEVSTIAGNRNNNGDSDGVGKAAMFSVPTALCFDKEGSLVICDFNNDKLRKLNIATGEVTTLCSVSDPRGIVVTNTGLLVVSSAHQVKVAIKKGNQYEMSVLAGSGSNGCEDGAPLSSKFDVPRGISIDPNTNTCFVVDSENHKLRKFTLF